MTPSETQTQMGYYFGLYPESARNIITTAKTYKTRHVKGLFHGSGQRVIVENMDYKPRRTAVVRKVALILMVSSILIVSGVRAETAGPNQDEMAIRKAIESYVAAYNSGDASAAASHWSRDGSYVAPTGEQAKGPDKIRPALEKFFAENKGIQVKAAVFDVQPQGGRAIITGFAVVTRPGEDKEEILFTATSAKEGGAWKLLKLEERGIPGSSGHYRETRGTGVAHWRLGGPGRTFQR